MVVLLLLQRLHVLPNIRASFPGELAKERASIHDAVRMCGWQRCIASREHGVCAWGWQHDRHTAGYVCGARCVVWGRPGYFSTHSIGVGWVGMCCLCVGMGVCGCLCGVLWAWVLAAESWCVGWGWDMFLVCVHVHAAAGARCSRQQVRLAGKTLSHPTSRSGCYLRTLVTFLFINFPELRQASPAAGLQHILPAGLGCWWLRGVLVAAR
mmetsp:Transcript_19581/g.49796  ORF Transcript_19581/g.49796 Transcript_19581/m.49796 type:complete len:210 (-) Transcript_19581:151-780(-)